MKATVISSFADDRLLLDKGKIEIREGGPARFISKVLQDVKIPFEICSGKKKAVVEIDMRNKIEKGRIKFVDKINYEPDENAEFILVSTLLDEYKLKATGKFCSLDLQGYVRDGNDFGKKKKFDSVELEKFDVVKATEEELRYIPKSRANKIKLLLLTKGADGFEIIENGKRYSFETAKIDAEDTIGAGDVLFSAFCIRYYQTKNLFESADFAGKIVAEFLRAKRRNVK